MTCGTAFWLMLSFAFMVIASLGHAAHPLRDSWARSLAAFVALVGAPAALLTWLGGRRRG